MCHLNHSPEHLGILAMHVLRSKLLAVLHWHPCSISFRGLHGLCLAMFFSGHLTGYSKIKLPEFKHTSFCRAVLPLFGDIASTGTPLASKNFVPSKWSFPAARRKALAFSSVCVCVCACGCVKFFRSCSVRKIQYYFLYFLIIFY